MIPLRDDNDLLREAYRRQYGAHPFTHPTGWRAALRRFLHAPAGY